MASRIYLRRKVLAGLVGAVSTSMFSSKIAAATSTTTPAAAQGPFYPTTAMRTADTDNNLVLVAGRVERAGGEIITLRGSIKDLHGRPLVGHRIEIWQCDVNGKYLHTADKRTVPYDQAFQGFGHDTTDASGGYVFRTIKPTIYPGRTPHIHVKVCNGETELLTTQFYLKDHPNNATDGLYNRLSQQQALAVSMQFKVDADGPEATVDIII